MKYSSDFTMEEFFSAANGDEERVPSKEGAIGVEIENETLSAKGGLTVHQRVRSELEAGDDDIIVYDHGTGELADFITLKKTNGIIFTRLYHCKGSGAAAAGARVDDLYEVCGQAQKSIAWANLQRLYTRVGQRKKATFVRGSFNALTALVEEGKALGKRLKSSLFNPA